MANAYKKRLQEMFGYTEDTRTFNEVYGNDAEKIFETDGYEVPDRFKKMFEAKKVQNKVLAKRLIEAMELIGHIGSGRSSQARAAMNKWRSAAKASMLKSLGETEYAALFESAKNKRRRLTEMSEHDFDMDDDDWSNDYSGDADDLGERDYEFEWSVDHDPTLQDDYGTPFGSDDWSVERDQDDDEFDDLLDEEVDPYDDFSIEETF